jgi:preprotein translocase subunit Sec61beta
MPKDNRRTGFHSAAGLIQYYDMEETRSMKIDPYAVLIMGIGAAVLIEVLNWKFV